MYKHAILFELQMTNAMFTLIHIKENIAFIKWMKFNEFLETIPAFCFIMRIVKIHKY